MDRDWEPFGSGMKSLCLVNKPQGYKPKGLIVLLWERLDKINGSLVGHKMNPSKNGRRRYLYWYSTSASYRFLLPMTHLAEPFVCFASPLVSFCFLFASGVCASRFFLLSKVPTPQMPSLASRGLSRKPPDVEETSTTSMSL